MIKVTWNELEAELGELGEKGCQCVEEWRLQAAAYVWGREDAGEARAYDGDVSWDFALAYGLHAAKFMTGKISFRLPLSSAWADFIAGVPLGTSLIG